MWNRQKIKASISLTLIILMISAASYQYGLSVVPLAGPYYLDVPFGDASFYVGKFDNGNTYMVDVDTWRNTWTSSNSTAIINAAMGNLTSGRTYQEKVLIDGEYTGLYQIQIPNYTILEIHGKLEAKDNLDTNFVTNNDHVNGNMHIEIFGGEIDGNGDTQTANLNTIYLENVDYANIHDLTVRGGYRDSTDGESIELATCTFCIVTNIVGFLYSSSYDHIKLTGVSTDNVIANNVLNGTDGPSAGTRSGAIQIATGGIRNIIEGNIISTHYAGVKLHAANENTIHGNTIVGLGGSEEGIGLIGTSSRNKISDNNINKIRALIGIRVRQTAGGERLADNIIENNIIINYDVAGARGIDILSGGLRTRLVHNTVIGGAVGSDVGVIVAATEVDDTYIGYNDFSDSNVNTKISDAGTNTIIENNRGYPDIYTAIYAELSDSTDQTFAVAGTAYSITFNTNDEIVGIIHSTTVNPENITIVTTGFYTLFAQPQVQATAGGAGTFHMWLQKDTGGGFVDVANTNIELSLASLEEDVIPLATTFSLNAGDTIRLRASVSDNKIKLDAQTPAGEPAIPSIIFTMFMIVA